MLGLFDRPADEKALEALLKSPAIPGLTESLTDFRPTAWRTILARLRRAKLLAGEDPHNPGHLDTHPLVREYFGEQLRSQQIEAWKECNKRLYYYYRDEASPLPASVREMEPLFLAVICGCNAGLYREALHDVYIPRIQRADAYFAAKVLGARGALVSVLIHFFQNGRWSSLVRAGEEGQRLAAEDQLFILMQAALYLTSARESAAEARVCYEHAESLCHLLDRPFLLYVTLMGQWRHTAITDKLSSALRIAERVHSLAEEQSDPRLMVGARGVLGSTRYFLGHFELAREHVMSGVEIWRAGRVPSEFEEVDSQPVACLCHQAWIEWHFGEIVSCHATIAEAISLAKQLNDMHGLALALGYAAVLGYLERNPAEVQKLTSELIELSTRHSFAHWLAVGELQRGWVGVAGGDTTNGISCIETGIKDYRAIGSGSGGHRFRLPLC
jgi:hypothetical protein